MVTTRRQSVTKECDQTRGLARLTGMHHHCGMGATIGFFVAVFVVAPIVLITVAVLIARAVRRRRPGEPVSLLVAEQLARGVLGRGTLELAIGTWGLIATAAMGHMVIATLLGFVASLGVLDCIAARRVLACIELPFATAEMRAGTLRVSTLRRVRWLGVSERALDRAQTSALPTTTAR
jgi:hypothetical protein